MSSAIAPGNPITAEQLKAAKNGVTGESAETEGLRLEAKFPRPTKDALNDSPSLCHADDAVARSAMWKAMWRIVPLILLAYVVAYMDRVNVSFAALQMNDDLKFSATIYGLGGGLFFLGYALFEVPSSLMLARYSAPQWIARIMITWGLLAAGMMFVRTPLQFYVIS